MNNAQLASAAADLNWTVPATGRPMVRLGRLHARVNVIAPSTRPLAIDPRAVTRVLAWAVVALVFLSTAGQLLRYLGGYPSAYGLVDFVFLDVERNLPTFYSGLQLLFAAGLLATITVLRARDGAPFARQWAVLAAGFMFMATDEWFAFHELVTEPVQDLLAGHAMPRAFTFAWVLPGMALVGVIGVSYIRFLRHLPVETCRTFLLAAFAYLGGAIGFELIGGAYAATHGLANLSYSLIATTEESLELVGIVVFVYGLLNYLANHYAAVRLDFVAAKR
jgi:hypothetical protein